MLLLIIVGASGSLEEQAKSFITYASIRAGIVVFCGLIIGKNIFQFCCSKRRNYDTPNFNNRRQSVYQGVSDSISIVIQI